MENKERELVSAGVLEERGILSRGTAYRMARLGHIPSYSVGVTGRGIRFRIEEVMAALRRPAFGGRGDRADSGGEDGASA